MVIGATILAVTAFTEINGVDVNGNTEGGWDSLWAKYECAYAKAGFQINTSNSACDWLMPLR